MNKVLMDIKEKALQKNPKMSFSKHFLSGLCGAVSGAGAGLMLGLMFAVIAGLIPIKLGVDVNILINYIKIFPFFTGFFFSYVFWNLEKTENKSLKYILNQKEINDYLSSIKDKRLQEKILNKISTVFSHEKNSLSLLEAIEIHEEITKSEDTEEEENKRLQIEKCLRDNLKQSVKL